MPEPSSQLVAGLHPDRGDDLVGRDPLAAGQSEPARLHGIHRGADPQVHACVGVPSGGLGSHRGTDRRGERRGPGFHHRDLAAVRDRGGGEFGADPPGSHDGQPQPGPEQVPQGQRVVVGTQEALPPRTGKRHRHRPGGQHQVVKGVRAAGRDQGGLVVEPGRGLLRAEVHAERREVGLQRRVEVGFRQHLLGQRRPVIRRP